MKPSTWCTLKSAITCCRVRCFRGRTNWLAMGHPDEVGLPVPSFRILPAGFDRGCAGNRDGCGFADAPGFTPLRYVFVTSAVVTSRYVKRPHGAGAGSGGPAGFLGAV